MMILMGMGFRIRSGSGSGGGVRVRVSNRHLIWFDWTQTIFGIFQVPIFSLLRFFLLFSYEGIIEI